MLNKKPEQFPNRHDYAQRIMDKLNMYLKAYYWSNWAKTLKLAHKLPSKYCEGIFLPIPMDEQNKSIRKWKAVKEICYNFKSAWRCIAK